MQGEFTEDKHDRNHRCRLLRRGMLGPYALLIMYQVQLQELEREQRLESARQARRSGLIDHKLRPSERERLGVRKPIPGRAVYAEDEPEKIYTSIMAAARQIGVWRNALADAIRKGRKCKGRVWHLVGNKDVSEWSSHCGKNIGRTEM